MLRGHEKEICGVAFSPDGQVLATTSGIRQYACGRSAIQQPSHACCGAMKKRFLALPSVRMARCSRRRAGIRRYACGRSAIQQPSPACCGAMKNEVFGVAFSPDGQVLATASKDQTVACGRSAIQQRSHACCGAMKKRLLASPSVRMARCSRRRAGIRRTPVVTQQSNSGAPRAAGP